MQGFSRKTAYSALLFIMRSYIKPPLSVEQQLSLLKERGLIINNYEFAKNVLSNLNYYNLSGYLYVFEKQSNIRTHIFENVTFEEVIRFFNTDVRIRQLILSLVSYVEVYMKNIIARTFVETYKDPFYNYKTDVYKNINPEINSLALNSKEVFIKHYRNEYSNFPELPIWISVEIMSLGILSKFYSYSENIYKNNIVYKMNLNHHEYLKNFMHFLTLIRNKSAHHSRILCINLDNKIKLPKKLILNSSYDIKLLNTNTLFNFIVNLEYIVRVSSIFPTSTLYFINEIYKQLYKLINNKSIKDKMFIHQYIGIIDSWKGDNIFKSK